MLRQRAKIIFLLFWLLPWTQALCQTDQQDSLALVDLYNSSNGPSWIQNTNWLTGTVDTWYGVSVTNHRVTDLFLIGDGSGGTLTSSIGNLTELTTFVMYDYQMTGSIPAELGNLTNLTYVNLGSNNFTGSIPASISNLVNLQDLQLGHNSLTGTIPAGIGNLTSLSNLDISFNSLSGPLPQGLFGIATLANLALNNNQIADTLRNSIYELYSLSVLDLSFNQLKGPLPDSLYALHNLNSLNLNNNQIGGELSTLVGHLTSLTKLHLSYNQLSCRIPKGLGNLTSLLELYLDHNKFDDLDSLTGIFGNLYFSGDLSHNLLQFGDMEANQGLGANFMPQDSLYFPIVYNLTTNDGFDETVKITGSDNNYQWLKDGQPLPGENAAEISRGPMAFSDAGQYILRITSNVITGDTLYRKAITLHVSACQSTVTAKDSLALVAIYNALDGPHWANQNGWLTGPLTGPVNSWDGVATDCGHVVTLDLRAKNPKGDVPPEIGDLKFLRYLDIGSANGNITSLPPEMSMLTNLQTLALYYTNINGNIPSWLTTLTQLNRLNFGSANLNGPIPESITDLGKLQYLDLSSNSLTGPIPASICQMDELLNLTLNNNKLSGSIPNGLSELSNLQELYVYFNSLTGYIPPSLNNLTALRVMDLGYNRLDGNVPMLDKLVNLEYLILHGDNLSGPFPGAAISNLVNLKDLNLEDNFFSDTIPPLLGSLSHLENININYNPITGTIPRELGNLSKLKNLLMDHDLLHGPIPAELGNLDSLIEMRLSYNQLSGPIPAQLGNLYSIANLELNSNQLSGSIPLELGNLIPLKVLLLGDNLLTGTIPKEFGSLPNLNTIELQNNQLSGTIPPELGNASQLGWINFETNQLSGTIPKELGNLANLSVLFIGMNQLTGTLPPELSQCTKLGDLIVDHNQLSGKIPASYSAFTNLYWVSMSYNSFTDSIPTSWSTNSQLNYLFIDNNKFTYVPDCSALPQLIGVFLDHNLLTFESIEPYYKVKSKFTFGFSYTPQDSVGVKKAATKMAGCPYAFSVNVGGSANSYQWYKNGVAISNTSSSISMAPVSPADAGQYTCAVTNSIVTGLTINTLPITLSVNPGVNAVLGEDLTNAQCNERKLVAAPSGLFSYQWYLDGDKMVGATNDTLVAYYDGNYSVIYQPDPTTCQFSTPSLGVTGLYTDVQPVITSFGSPVTTMSTNYAAATVQWYVNDKVIANATSDSIDIWYNGTYYLVAHLLNNCNYRSNTILVNESKYGDLSRLASTSADTIVLQAPGEFVLIYPNPSPARVNIEAGSFAMTGVEFYDNSNKSVYKKEFENTFTSMQVDISSWSPGIYLIAISSGEKRIWRKLVKY